MVPLRGPARSWKTDPKLDSLIQRYGGILLDHIALDFNGTACRIHRAGELHQHAVADRLTMRPRWKAMAGSTTVLRTAFSRASVLSSSTPIIYGCSRQHPPPAPLPVAVPRAR
jgi:hypothetical protein